VKFIIWGGGELHYLVTIKKKALQKTKDFLKEKCSKFTICEKEKLKSLY
jgi:hypothetical protein